MAERHPTDAQLLSLTHDPATGVEYIPTGQSPYYLAYRRSLQRLLRVAERANDLRVYDAGGLTLGVRPGRCLIGGEAVVFPGLDALTLPVSTTSHLWIDAAGLIQHGTSGLPADRSTFLPLAQVTTAADSISTLTDLRGEAFLQAANTAQLGLTATAAEINRALDGINDSVDAFALNILTAGDVIPADVFHTHHVLQRDSAGTATFTLRNDSDSDQANVRLQLSVPHRADHPTWLSLNPEHHYLDQTYHQTSLAVVGSANLGTLHAGPLLSSQSGRPLAVVPLDGQVETVILSVGDNLQSSATGDTLSALVNVNGNPLTTSPPTLTADAGPGFRSTERGDGSPAVVTTGSAATLRRGDLLTVDLTRTVAGTLTREPTDVGVLVVIRATRPL